MKSMTGHGRCQLSENGWHATVEMHSVNRKQLEVAVNLPRDLTLLEPRLRELVAGSVSRGRINVQATCVRATTVGGQPLLDLEYAAACHSSLLQLQEMLGLKGAVDFGTLLTIPGVLRNQLAEPDQEIVWPILSKATELALRDLTAMREHEGQQLAADLQARLGEVRKGVEAIRSLQAYVLEKYRAALHERIRKAGVEMDLDEERLTREVVLFADRCDISEELTRLESHLGQFDKHLRSALPVGRTLEFLGQEIGRELNTVGSKGNDATISQWIVACKVELERIREQVQNIE